MTSKFDRFFNPKDGTYANVPIIAIHPEKYQGKRFFSNNVLIGNWYEDKLKFKNSLHRSKTFYNIDYPAHAGSVPDTVLRRKLLASQDSRPARLILDHHDIEDRKQHISSYDEQYNRRGAYGEFQDASERSWLILEKRWIPERSDHPLEAAPTTWGLVEKKRSQSQNNRQQRLLPEVSEYAGRYVSHPSDAYTSSRCSGIPRTYTRFIDRSNSLKTVMKIRPDTDFSSRQPITPDTPDTEHIHSIRRNENVPRALFFLGKVPCQTTRKRLPLETESTSPVLPVTATVEQTA